MTFTRLRDWGVIPLRPRLGGFTAKRRGLNKEAAGRSTPGVVRIARMAGAPPGPTHPLKPAGSSSIHGFLQGTDNPRQWGKALTGRYAGLWRYRIGDYRLVCQLQDTRLVVLVVKVGHRRNVYQGNPPQ